MKKEVMELANGYAEDLAMFTADNTAPAAVPKKQPSRQNLRVLKETKRSQRERIAYQEKRSFFNTLRILMVTVVAVTIIGSLVYQRVRINQLDHAIAAVQASMEEAKSENVRLSLKKESLVSTDKVRSFAENKLGMIQRDRYRIHYFDLTDSDSGTVRSGKDSGNLS